MIARRPVPEGEPGLVHADLWLGNTMWVGAEFSGFIDWDCAGIGEAGLDVAATIQDQGRPDLDQPVLEGRRDAFLRAALDRLA